MVSTYISSVSMRFCKPLVSCWGVYGALIRFVNGSLLFMSDQHHIFHIPDPDMVKCLAGPQCSGQKKLFCALSV